MGDDQEQQQLLQQQALQGQPQEQPQAGVDTVATKQLGDAAEFTAVRAVKAAPRCPDTEAAGGGEELRDSPDDSTEPPATMGAAAIADASPAAAALPAPRRDEAKRTRDEAEADEDAGSDEAARRKLAATPAGDTPSSSGAAEPDKDAPTTAGSTATATSSTSAETTPAAAAASGNVATAATPLAGVKEGSWVCPACGNVNYSNRTRCNMRRCALPRPGLAGAAPGEDSAEPSANKRSKSEHTPSTSAADKKDGSWCVSGTNTFQLPLAAAPHPPAAPVGSSALL